MQPRPSADTVGPSRPSVRSFMGALCTHAASWSDGGMDYGLNGRVALVTGAASGIGRATAELFAAMRARVVACDVNADAGAAVAAALREAGAEARFVAADVTDGVALREVVADAVAAFGRLDCAANCAGVGGGHASTHEYPEDEWDRIVEINLRGTWLTMRAEIEAMLDGGGGAIVNVVLDARPARLALRGRPTARASTPSSASRGRRRLEYAAQGIRVNAVCPGAIDTPMMDATFERFPGFREALTGFVPMGRMGGPRRSPGRSRG